MRINRIWGAVRTRNITWGSKMMIETSCRRHALRYDSNLRKWNWQRKIKSWKKVYVLDSVLLLQRVVWVFLFGLVWFCGISTILGYLTWGYLIKNYLYSYVYDFWTRFVVNIFNEPKLVYFLYRVKWFLFILWTGEQWQWRGTPYSSVLQHYLNLIIR